MCRAAFVEQLEDGRFGAFANQTVATDGCRLVADQDTEGSFSAARGFAEVGLAQAGRIERIEAADGEAGDDREVGGAEQIHAAEFEDEVTAAFTTRRATDDLCRRDVGHGGEAQVGWAFLEIERHRVVANRVAGFSGWLAFSSMPV